MKEAWDAIRFIASAILGGLSYFFGECDGLIIALIVFVATDYLTGVMCAIAEKKLSSEIGFKGIFKKILIFLIVGVANILDSKVIGTGGILRSAVAFFYISNEGISLLENAARLGVPFPQKLKDVLNQLRRKADSKEDDDDDNQNSDD